MGLPIAFKKIKVNTYKKDASLMKNFSLNLTFLLIGFFLIVFTTDTSFSRTKKTIETLEGKVIKISDGDSLHLLVNKNTIKVRLAEIDAPEKKQDFGTQSQKKLSELVFQKDVKAECPETDRYQRKVCYIYFNNLEVNLEMVRLGLAWVYEQYSKSSQYQKAQELAQKEKLGLWSHQGKSQAVAPWDWRKQEADKRAAKRAKKDSSEKRIIKMSFDSE